MVLESWDLIHPEDQNVPLFVRGTLVSACKWHGHRGAHECLQIIELERVVEELLDLSSGLCLES